MPSLSTKSRIVQRLLGTVRKALLVRLPQTRPVIEQMLYAICRRGASRNAADVAFSQLQQGFYDWNEVRVSSIREVAETLRPLPEPFERAEQILGLLHEVFEAHYSFNLDGLKKKPLRQVEKHLSRFRYADPFVVAWTVQYALNGHAVPMDEPARRVAARLGLVTDEQPLPAVQTSLAHQLNKSQAQFFYEVLSAIADKYCREEPTCTDCPMKSYCPTGRQIFQPTTLEIRRQKPR